MNKWLKRFQLKGVEGLEDRPRSGRPKRIQCLERTQVDRGREARLPGSPPSEPYMRFWRVAAGIPFRVRPAALAEPDVVRYTIRLPAGVIHRGLAPSV